jgi:hypothetical protein
MDIKSPLQTWPIGKRTEDTAQPNMSKYPTEQGRTHWHQLEDIRLNLEIANHIAENKNSIEQLKLIQLERIADSLARLGNKAG